MALNIGGTPVPQFFFKIRVSDGDFDDDPHGTNLPNLAAAFSYAERTIKELRCECGFDDPGLMMLVEDEAHQAVLSLPFFPGCA
jgi:hypothetical protein